jgi:hypothetical protein
MDRCPDALPFAECGCETKRVSKRPFLGGGRPVSGRRTGVAPICFVPDQSESSDLSKGRGNSPLKLLPLIDVGHGESAQGQEALGDWRAPVGVAPKSEAWYGSWYGMVPLLPPVSAFCH